MLEPLLNKVPVLLNKIEIKLSRNKVGIFFILKHKITLLYYSHSFVLSLVAILCHSSHSLSFLVTRCTTRCHSLYHSLPFVVPLVVTRCHSLLFVVTRCTTRCHSMNQSSVFLQTIVRSRSCLCSSERNNRKNKLTDLIFLSLWKIQIEKKL